MKKILLCTILFFVFLSSVAVSGVSAELELKAPTSLDEKIISDNEVSQETAYQAALSEAAPYIANDMCCEPSDTWEGAYVKRENPLKIHDISGYILFYDFDIVRNNSVVGIIRVSANKLVSHPAPKLYCGSETESRRNLTNSADYYQNCGCSATIIGSYYGPEYLLVECNNSDKESFVFDPWWIREFPVNKFKSFYKDYTFDPEAAVNQWNYIYNTSVGIFPSENETEGKSSEFKPEELVNISETDLPKETRKTTSPGFSGIVAVMAFGLFLFIYRDFS